MPDHEADLDPFLLALARALGRYQASLDAARKRSSDGDRTSDSVDEQVFTNTEKVANGAFGDEFGSSSMRLALQWGYVEQRSSRWIH